MKTLDIEDLETRRIRITLRFAKNARHHQKLNKHLRNNPKTHKMDTRKGNLYDCTANTDRYKKSPLLYMQKLLNELKKHLSTDADSSTDTTVGWIKNTQKPKFFEKRKKSSKTQKLKNV